VNERDVAVFVEDRAAFVEEGEPAVAVSPWPEVGDGGAEGPAFSPNTCRPQM
jgi:hypothetical protein